MSENRIIISFMQSIEDLINQVVGSTTFKREVQKQLRYCLEQQQTQEQSNAVALPDIIQEINGYISDITEMALEEENSKNYITFMKKSEQLCLEVEKKLSARIEANVEELNLRIESISLKLNELSKGVKHGLVESKLKEERKFITRNLLETSRFQNAAKTESTINLKSCIRSLKSSHLNSTEDILQGNDINSTLDASTERLKLQQIEKECKKHLQVWWSKVETTIDCLKQDQETLNKSCIQLSQKSQAKLDGNLQSVWNVISDLCSRISKFEIMGPFES